MAEDGGGEMGGGEADDGTYLPRLQLGPHVAHYYGDYVRKLFLTAAVAMFLFAPFVGGALLPVLIPIQIGGGVMLIILAALTNPKNKLVMLADSTAAGVGVLVFETSALVEYFSGDYLSFTVHEVLALVLMFALYFSVKTVRAMQLGQIGKREAPGEFRKVEFDDTRALHKN